MLLRSKVILIFLFICMLTPPLAQLVKAQIQSSVNPSLNGSLMEFPGTFIVIRNPQTGQFQVINFTINDNSVVEDKNKPNKNILPEDLEHFTSSCDAVLNNGNLVSTNYIIIGKVRNTTSIASDKNTSPLSVELHDIKNSGSDKIFLKLRNGVQIEPKIVNLICEYGKSTLNNTGKFDSKGKFISFLSTRCSDKFQDTIYKLNGELMNKLNINFSSPDNTNPNIKIALKNEIGLNKISGYLSKYVSGADRGNFTINSVNITCSLQPLI